MTGHDLARFVWGIGLMGFTIMLGVQAYRVDRERRDRRKRFKAQLGELLEGLRSLNADMAREIAKRENS